MKLRLIKRDGQHVLLCDDGTIAHADDKIIRKLFVRFKTPSSFSGSYGRWDQEATTMESVKGSTLAYVNEENELCLVENPFLSLMQNLADDEYITLHEYAEIHQKNDNRIKALCREE